MPAKLAASRYVEGLKNVLDLFDLDIFQEVVDHLLAAYEQGRQIFVMGNGGSGSTAAHFACDINKGCCMDLTQKFKVICLNDNLPTLLALANDVGYEAVFVEQLKNYFNPGDLVIGISGSGNSENVLAAMRHARQNGGYTIGFCGFDGGELGRLAHTAFVAASNDMQKIEDAHVIWVHMLMQALHHLLHEDATAAAGAEQ